MNVALCYNCIFHGSCALIRGKSVQYRCYQPKTKESSILEFADNPDRAWEFVGNGWPIELEYSRVDRQCIGGYHRRLVGSLKKASKEEKVR